MSSTARRLHYTYSEYLALEAESSVRHEYLEGEIYAKAGGTPRAADDSVAVTNPVLLVEVTSPSTGDYARGKKLRHYKTLEGLREVLFVSHREPRLELHRSEGGAWITLAASRGETLSLESIASEIAVDDVYKGGLEDSA
jgi:Uma2 family endonuclease